MKRTIQLSFLISVIVASSALLASPALAAVPRWQPVGPFGHDGYRLFPTGDPAILYVTTNYSGLYRSEDGGQSWREVNPMNFGALSVDLRDPDVLFGAPGIYEKVVRSDDGGRTFRTAADGLLYQDQNPQILSFVRHPTDPGVVFAATEFGLFRNDGGGDWELIAFAGFAVTAFAIDPLSPAVWHAATNDYALQGPGDVLISTDAGATWSRVPGEIDRRQVGPMFFDPVRPHRVYTLANCRPAVFTGGAWRPLPLAGSRHTCTMTITEEGRLVASFFDPRRWGVMVSDDGGETWTAYGGPGDLFFRIADPGGEGEVLVASGGRGLWRSVDGGVTWRASSRGISGFVVGDIAVAADGAVFASPGGEGVFRSRDAGRSWDRLVRGLHADARGTPALAVDPRDASVVWAGGAELHRSRDAGRTWQGLSLPRGVEDREIVQILIDPTREGVVYVRTYAPIGEGVVGPFVYRTLDDGRTWQPLPRLHRTAHALAVAPSDGTLYAWADGGIFVSRDAGSTWRRVQRSLSVRVNTLAVDPERSNVLWVSSDDQGVWRSADGGRSFTRLTRGELLIGSVGDLVFDPADPAHPYVSVAVSGVYQWRREGWQKVGAGNARFEGTVNGPLAFDAERGILYAGTSTRGIYRLVR
ncbi:MAG TPA: hypothetical protein VF756_18995 [Thermoanaerobaculia bacterium]